MSSPVTRLPEIVAVRDAATSRDLLLDPRPLTVTGAATATLRVENGPGGPLRLAISADKPWLQPDQESLELPAGGAAELRMTVLSDGPEEFAVLQLAWQAAGEDFAEHVLVQRPRPVSKPASPAKPSPPPPAQSKPSTGTTALPDWMQES